MYIGGGRSLVSRKEAISWNLFFWMKSARNRGSREIYAIRDSLIAAEVDSPNMSDAQKSGGDTGSGDVPLEPQEIRVCPTCKTPLTADSVSEFCPVCMLRSALNDTAESVHPLLCCWNIDSTTMRW